MGYKGFVTFVETREECKSKQKILTHTKQISNSQIFMEYNHVYEFGFLVCIFLISFQRLCVYLKTPSVEHGSNVERRKNGETPVKQV